MADADATQLYRRYVTGWTGITPEERAALMAEIVEDGFTYRTHKYDVAGITEAIGDMESFQSRYSGGLADVEDVSAHHDVALLTWVLSDADGTLLLRGKDQITLSERGRLAGLITFGAATPI